MLNVVYMGTPDFAVPALQSLITSPHKVIGVVTNPDKAKGRGKKLTAPPVKEVALAANIEVFQPKSLRHDDSLQKLHEWAPDVIVVAAYGKILPQSILDIPQFGCINIHASLLPKYRGAAPINWSIVRGEKQTGITIMQMDVGLDTGDILLQKAIPITDTHTAQTLHDELAVLGAELIVPALDLAEKGELRPISQDDSKSCYAPMLSKSDGSIDWNQSAREIVNHIHGFNPWPGAFSFHHQGTQKSRIKFHTAQALDNYEHCSKPGTVLEADSTTATLVIGGARGAIRCQSIQMPGRRAMTVRDFLNGYAIEINSFFDSASS